MRETCRSLEESFGEGMHLSEKWTVLAEHGLPYAWVPIDEGSLELLFLEDELNSHGIQVMFEPYRPGESGGYTESLGQPLRLLVRDADLPRAREIATAALARRDGGG